MRKCLPHRYKLSNRKASFHACWKQILMNDSQNCLQTIKSLDIDNSFFENVPFNQELLTNDQMVYVYEIEFQNFLQFKYDAINERNTFDCFHGILYYIYYYSNCKLNIKEVRFHYSGSKNRKSLLSIAKNNPSNYDLYDILNIFSYNNINNLFVVNSIRNAFFGVSFLRIKVNPIAYSIRAGSFMQLTGTLTSFTFQGYDEEEQRWIILDERSNINDLNVYGGFKLFYVRSTTKSFSSFKIQQTEPGYDGFWGFTIAGFDVHGIISYKENLCQNNFFSEENAYSLKENELSYDENIDMAKYII